MHNKQKVQALLEVVIALAIVVIVAAAFVTLGATAVRNSSFSQNQVDATKLAQEGIEAMITIRDQNSVGAIQGYGVDQWEKLFGTAMGCGTPNDLTVGCEDFSLQETPCTLASDAAAGVTPTPVAQECITKNSAGFEDASWNVNNVFTTSPTAVFSRKIRIADSTDPNIKDVTVFVWWNDSTGRHQSILTRKLSKEGLSSQ